MKKNKQSLSIVNDDFLNLDGNLVKDLSLDLVIADPPYFKVIGETWDTNGVLNLNTWFGAKNG